MVYDHLRDGVAGGAYRPHDRLIEEDLARLFTLSRTPVRQALQLLESEGIVRSTKQGWFIREFSAQDIRQVYDVRIALEGYASALAADRADRAAVQRMWDRHAQATVQLALTDRDAFVRAHHALHQAIVEAAGNQLLAERVAQYRNHHFNRSVAALYQEGELERAQAGHAAIIGAIDRRDPAAAETLTREHLRDALTFTLSVYAQRSA